MHCDVNSKVMLIRAGLERYLEYTPAAQRALGEGIFWLCDGMLEEITNDETSSYRRSNLECVKDLSNQMVKQTLSKDELFEMQSYCAKLTKY